MEAIQEANENATPESAASPPRPIADAKRASKAHFLAVLAWTVVLGLGACHHRSTDDVRPVTTPMRAFDVALRRWGPAMPWTPFVARLLATSSTAATDEAKGRSRREENVVVGIAYLAVTVLRWIVYPLVRHCQCTSDHVFLAMSLSAMLVTEMALVADAWEDGRVEREFDPCRAWWMHLCWLQAAVLLILLYGDMYYTARYFHTPEEIGISYAMGTTLFMVPMGLFTRRTMERRSVRRTSIETN
eukprot:jgi/Pico_ML_1/52396/g3105.t1